jgi:hypothetical protein
VSGRGTIVRTVVGVVVTTALPHSPQNMAPSGSSVEQYEQITGATP